MTSLITVDRLLSNPTYAILLNEVYSGLEGNLEESIEIKNILETSRKEVKKRNINWTKPQLRTGIDEMKNGGIFIILPGSPPFSDGDTDRIGLSDFSKLNLDHYLGYIERVLKCYDTEKKALRSAYS